MTINELLALNGLTANDEIPVWDAEAEPNEPTKKITGSNLASSIKTLGSLLGTSDVVDNLTSTSTTAPLSAAQGKTLNDNINKQWLTIQSAPTVLYSLTSGTQYTFTAPDDGLYFVRAVNTSTAGDCNVGIWQDTARQDIIGATYSGTGTYIRATSSVFPLRKNAQIVVMANFTNYGQICRIT